MGCEDVMNLRNLSQEELIKMINEKDKKIEALTEQLNWYSQQIKLQQKKLFGSSSEKTVLPDQISLFDEIEHQSSRNRNLKKSHTEEKEKADREE